MKHFTTVMKILCWCYLWNENSELSESIYSIDDLKQNQIVLYIIMGEGARGQDSGEKEREWERENEHRLAADVVSVVKRTIRKYTCLIKLDGQHLAGLLLINKMRNLAHDVSHDRSVLTVKIFGAMTTRHFLIKI